jgi:hypothetical protein
MQQRGFVLVFFNQRNERICTDEFLGVMTETIFAKEPAGKYRAERAEHAAIARMRPQHRGHPSGRPTERGRERLAPDWAALGELTKKRPQDVRSARCRN